MRLPKFSQKRTLWVGLSAVSVGLLSLCFVVPALFAQDAPVDYAEVQRYDNAMEKAYADILNNYVDKVDARKLYEGAMTGMLNALNDPYSFYLNDDLLSDLTDTTQGNFGGIGLSISKQRIPPLPNGKASTDPAFIEIYSVFEGTPGAKAGFKPGDLIVKIGDKTTADMDANDAQKLLRGVPGTPVDITIQRGSTELKVNVTRAVIEVPTVRSAMIPHGNSNIAYMRIVEFTPQTFPRVQAAIGDFNRSNYTGMIIDLRSNPGGLLSSVESVADLFLDKGLIVFTKSRNAYRNEVSQADSFLAVPKDKKLVVLIDRGSASAAEILAGALKDNKRAFLIGENTYGKGSVQQILPLDTTGYKMTVARYYTPSDENIDKTGIPPDIEIKAPELSDDQLKVFKKLYESGVIEQYAKNNPKASDADRAGFVKKLIADGYTLPERNLKQLIKNEFNRLDAPPIYDLEFDVQLQTALATFDDPNYDAKLATTKTVRELVEAKKSATAQANKTSEPKSASTN